MDRRKYLAAAAGTIAAFSGCTTPEESSSENVPEDMVGPDVDLGDGWEQTDSWDDVVTESALGTDVNANIKTEIYENVSLSEELYEKTLGNFEETAMLFFVSRIELEGLLSVGARVSDIEDAGLPEVEEQLDSQGLQNVHERSTVDSPEPELGFRSNTREYSGEYTVEGPERDVEIAEVGTVPLSFDDASLEVRTIVSSWRDGTNEGYMAGGAYPASNYSDWETINVSGSDTDGISVTVDIDLGIDPDELRQEIVELVETVGG